MKYDEVSDGWEVKGEHQGFILSLIINNVTGKHPPSSTNRVKKNNTLYLHELSVCDSLKIEPLIFFKLLIMI